MKKTLTINLGGTVYHIDEDAYILLDNYLNNSWKTVSPNSSTSICTKVIR